ncbi:hypothetical protein [Stackebrandtia nassauensis]|uniref:Uncharacterized protein n=1 Tax=Stackebrandtia nassauensis (strain DSM 44728 / CIP 108903 / NRRL B-16338 / NBRC 102104 / LLR-40K-21) TaxID=446470 RepID=D3QC43_STANL|nr:hypothetical protein [Stackebrandtia nassauensis]ADD39763.1 hypothetical protein Snas_0041 [Stackebrandtia nassauensis DSM 44728]
MVTFQQLRTAKLDTIQDQVDTWQNVSTKLTSLQTTATNVGTKISGGTWEGLSGFAAVGRTTTLSAELKDAASEVNTVKGLLDWSKGQFVAQKNSLDQTVTAVNNDPRLTISDTGHVKPDVEAITRQTGAPSVLELLEAQKAADTHNGNIKKILAWVSYVDAQSSDKLRAAVNLDSPKELDFNGEAAKDADAVDFPGPADPAIAAAQSAAFEKTLGRPPVTETDWKLAAALDPTSRLDKNGGKDAVVAVGRITPRPGEGLVRIGLYIPSKEVFNLPNYDLGDNRGMDPNFNPEDARVTLYVDYETGTVLARQNPSVDTSGEVRVATPSVQVQESTNGAVRIQYDASNPFAPPGSDQTGHTVKGDITVSPGQPPRVDGAIGDYPAFEAYHDSNNGPTTTLVQDRADNEGNFGPLLELPTDHEIGAGRGGPPAQFKEWRHLSGDDWIAHGEAPSTNLGDPGNPPTVTPYKPYGGSEFHPNAPGVPPTEGEFV